MNPSKLLNAGDPKPDSPAKTAKPRTPAQIAASRANGCKSCGPTTAAGKLRASKNAILHGLTCTEHTLLVTEDPAQYKEVCDGFIEDLRPGSKSELRLVEKIANLDWRLERMVMMETCVLNMEVGCSAEKIANSFSDIDGIGFIVEAWKVSLSATHCLDLLRRYMGTLQHQFNTTLTNFYKLETNRLKRRHDPDSVLPYERPALDTLDPIEDLKEEEQEEHDEQPIGVQPLQRNEPKPDTKSVTPINISDSIGVFRPIKKR
ncbi:MAG TPA: hypothetical protein VGL53_23310 [Bryobacteraceae bacterium]|jgi:hypothetical protein